MEGRGEADTSDVVLLVATLRQFWILSASWRISIALLISCNLKYIGKALLSSNAKDARLGTTFAGPGEVPVMARPNGGTLMDLCTCEP